MFPRPLIITSLGGGGGRGSSVIVDATHLSTLIAVISKVMRYFLNIVILGTSRLAQEGNRSKLGINHLSTFKKSWEQYMSLN